MAYHLFTCVPSQTRLDPVFDCYLGSGVTVAFYWESIGKELDLPIIATLMDRADSEGDQGISSNELILFRDELELFETYWTEQSVASELPEGFLLKVRDILAATNKAIADGLTLFVG